MSIDKQKFLNASMVHTAAVAGVLWVGGYYYLKEEAHNQIELYLAKETKNQQIAVGRYR